MLNTQPRGFSPIVAVVGIAIVVMVCAVAYFILKPSAVPSALTRTSISLADAEITYQAPIGWTYKGQEGSEKTGYHQARYWSTTVNRGAPDAAISITISKMFPNSTSVEKRIEPYKSGEHFVSRTIVISGIEGTEVEVDSDGKHHQNIYVEKGDYLYAITASTPAETGATFAPAVNAFMSSLSLK